MRILVGTSGYQYKEWKGSFYPDDMSTDGMLAYYAGEFPTVEVNNTFYRIPKEAVVVKWTEQVPDGFRFVLKASRRITHMHRLKNTEEPLQWYLRACSQLGPKRGASLFQLPPNMKKDLERLQTFLGLLPNRWPAALEFRHESWFDDDVYEVLRERNAALCVADTAERDLHRIATADWGYLRLRREQYRRPALKKWGSWITDQEWQEAYVFFKHEDEGTGPELGKRFMEVIG